MSRSNSPMRDTEYDGDNNQIPVSSLNNLHVPRGYSRHVERAGGAVQETSKGGKGTNNKKKANKVLTAKIKSGKPFPFGDGYRGRLSLVRKLGLQMPLYKVVNYMRQYINLPNQKSGTSSLNIKGPRLTEKCTIALNSAVSYLVGVILTNARKAKEKSGHSKLLGNHIAAVVTAPPHEFRLFAPTTIGSIYNKKSVPVFSSRLDATHKEMNKETVQAKAVAKEERRLRSINNAAMKEIRLAEKEKKLKAKAKAQADAAASAKKAEAAEAKKNKHNASVKASSFKKDSSDKKSSKSGKAAKVTVVKKSSTKKQSRGKKEEEEEEEESSSDDDDDDDDNTTMDNTSDDDDDDDNDD
jgi:hypothetical protein